MWRGWVCSICCLCCAAALADSLLGDGSMRRGARFVAGMALMRSLVAVLTELTRQAG